MEVDESSSELSKNNSINNNLNNGRYQIIKCIGEGGFGKVFLVKDLKSFNKEDEL
jgi:serine/threonine protein kinase